MRSLGSESFAACMTREDGRAVDTHVASVRSSSALTSLLYPATFAAKIAEVFVADDVGTFEWDFVTTALNGQKSGVGDIRVDVSLPLHPACGWRSSIAERRTQIAARPPRVGSPSALQRRHEPSYNQIGSRPGRDGNPKNTWSIYGSRPRSLSLLKYLLRRSWPRGWSCFMHLRCRGFQDLK
jgi:hypothetical protein